MAFDFKNHPTFCAAFWTTLTVADKYKVWPCCKFVKTLQNNELNTKTIDFYDAEEILNQEYFIELRNKIVNGEHVEECRRCFIDEELGKKSLRNIYNESLTPVDKRIITESISDDCRITEFKPSEIYPILSNKCNSKCRSCSPFRSNTFYSELKNTNSEVLIDTYTLGLINQKERKIQTHQLSRFNKYYDSCRAIKFAGGEPFIIDEFYETIDYLIGTGLSKNIHIEIISNFNVTTYKERELLRTINYIISNFKSVYLVASVDEVDSARFSYMRHGSNLNLVLQNVKDVSAIKTPKFTFCIASVYSVFNVFRFAEINEFLRSSFPHTRIDCQFVTTPQFLNIGILNTQFNNQLIQTFHDSTNFNSIQSLTMREKFVQVTEELDKIRNENWKETFPELIEHFSFS